MLHWMARLLPLRRPTAYYFTLLFIGPLLGSFITEPAAMTLSALLLRERYFSRQAPRAFKYGTLSVLFVNVSIGGTLTPFALRQFSWWPSGGTSALCCRPSAGRPPSPYSSMLLQQHCLS